MQIVYIYTAVSSIQIYSPVQNNPWRKGRTLDVDLNRRWPMGDYQERYRADFGTMRWDFTLPKKTTKDAILLWKKKTIILLLPKTNHKKAQAQ